MQLERNKYVSTIDVNNLAQQLNNSIDEKEEIITDDEKLNVILRLYDETYEEFINRTDLFAGQDISFKEALHDTDATFNMYADFYPDGDIKMTAYMESDELGWTDAEVPLTEDEKKVLREDLDRVAKYCGTTVQKLFDEALGIEPDEPEKKIS